MKRKSLLVALAAAVMLLCAVFGAACSDDVKLSFETNGGIPVAGITAKAGDEVVLPSTTKSGFAFDGWYTSSDFSGERLEGKISAPEKNTKYYAKWATGYEVKLDPDGGALTTGSLWLKEGANVFEAVSGLVPVKSGLSFGAWFLDGAELPRAYRMPAQEVTLTAKYKAGYIIQIYLQNLSRNSYQRTDALETTGSGYVNTAVTPDPPAVANFTYQPSPEDRNPVPTLTLKENAEENVYSLYYDRNEYFVVYDGNPPAGTEITGATPYTSVVYGGTTAAGKNGFSVPGYRFAGWGLSPTGGVDYLPDAQIAVESPITLYAIWDKGFTDRSGGDDLIYFPRTDDHKAILARNGVEFEGTRDGNAFSFTTSAGDTFGGVVVGGAFSYENRGIVGKYVFYDNYPHPEDEEFEEEDRYDETRTLEVDEYLGAVYTEKNDAVHGALTFDPNRGDYLFTSDDGSKSFHTLFIQSADQSRKIFSVGGVEFGYYANSSGQIIVLDGYGTAFLEIYASGEYYSVQGIYYIEGDGMAYDRYFSYKVVCWLNDTAGLVAGGQGWKVYYLCMLPDVLPEIGPDYGLYYFADSSRGEYENGNETLTLDGHGYYTDSAVYKDGEGEVLKGGYRITSDFVSGSVIELLDGQGEVVKRFRLSSDGAFSVYSGPAVPYTEYYLLEGESMKPVLLALFEEEYEQIPGSMRAEFYANNSRGVASHAASGYVTSQPAEKGQNILLYTFHRTSVEYGFDQTIPENMIFTLTVVEVTSSGARYSVYSVLAENGQNNYQIVKLPNGGEVWANLNVTAEGEGSLYFIGGKGYRCSFLTYRDTYFGELYGEVSYSEENSEVGDSMLYLLTASSEEGIDYTAKEAEGLPREYCYFDPDYSPTNGPIFSSLVLGSGGRAAYDEAGTNIEWSIGSYRATEEHTNLGAQVYELVFGNEVRFTFVLGTVNFFGISYDGYFREIGKAGVYTEEGGGTLFLDGYGTARYSLNEVSMSGSYYFLTDNILRFDSADGTQCEFELSDESFTALDPAYGEWDLVDGNFHPLNNFSKIYFDGKGNYTITVSRGTGAMQHGFYEISDPAHGEYILYQATIGGRKDNYYVRFMEYVEYSNYNCVVRDRASGVYVDENYNVLSLNGFGSGSIKGNVYNSMGNFYVIDDNLGFGYFQFTTLNTGYEYDIVHLLLDYERGTFEILEYTNELYIASDLDHVAFRDDGAAFLGNMLNGDYLVTENGVNVYIYDQESYVYRKYELPALGTEEYKYNNKTYYRYTDEYFTAEGKIVMLDQAGKPQTETPEVSATLSFEARPRSFIAFEVTFTIANRDYGGFLLYSYTKKVIDPRLEYNNLVYNIDFERGANGWTFTVTDAGVRVFTRNDNKEPFYDGADVTEGKSYSGGKLDVTYNGFGGYELSEATYSGKFYYCYNGSAEDKGLISFDGLPASKVRTIGYHDLGSQLGGYSYLREILFDFGDKTYAIDFFEYSLVSGGIETLTTYHYLLYGFSEYDEVDAEEYKLGVKYLIRTNLSGSPGYGDDSAVGKPMTVTLLGGKDKDTPVVAVSTDARYTGNGVWLVENDGGYAGAAYLVTFEYGSGENAGKVLSGSVQKGSVQTVGLAATYNFYLFVDANGDAAEIMAAWYGSTKFQSVYNISKNDDVWTFYGKEIETEPLRKYTLTFTKGGSGKYTVTVDDEIVEEP